MLRECEKGNHELIIISSHTVADEEEVVVRWCKICGSVVVDRDVHGRTDPGRFMKMKTPLVSKKK